MNTITVQVSAGNAILQDTKTIAVYGECLCACPLPGSPCLASPGSGEVVWGCRLSEAPRPLPRPQRAVVEKELSQVWSHPPLMGRSHHLINDEDGLIIPLWGRYGSPA